ncbi:MAG: reverse transcriptase family protein [Candidatus Hodarchaeota archaeon]
MTFPQLQSIFDLLSLLEIKQPCLDHLLDPTKSHYTYYSLPKKRGGYRRISSPSEGLKAVQKRIQRKILDKFQHSAVCHGFTAGKSIVTNAFVHQNSTVLVNVDLKNFFESITYPRVVGVYSSLGYPFKISSMLAFLSTIPRSPYGRTSYRVLAQGAPTSPQISNIICKRLDDRILTLCRKNRIRHTRYADDLSFSMTQNIPPNAIGNQIGLLLTMIRKIIASEGFKVNEKKLGIFFPKDRQEVTGLSVNHYVNVNRAYCLRIRGIVHRTLKEVEKGREPTFSLKKLEGSISFIQMVRPEKTAKLATKMQRITKILELNGRENTN